MISYPKYYMVKDYSNEVIRKKMYNAWTYDSYPVMTAILFFIGCPKLSESQ